MKLSGIDANLLVALDALLSERSVTRAAGRLGVGQPAMSHSLARLRDHFKDPLLVPRGREMVLSEKALRLVDRVARAAAAFASIFEDRSSFDPHAARRFGVASTDLFALRFVPGMLRTIAREAPGVELELRPLVSACTQEILRDGVDLAFGVFEDVPPELNQQHLFHDPLVCVVRADHPEVGAAIALPTYVSLGHLEVVPAPHARPGEGIDRQLAASGERRRVTTRVPYYLVAARVLAESDLVLTMTRASAESLTAMAALKIVEAPFDLPPLAFSQVWSRRHDQDGAHRWLRETTARICSAPRTAAP
jgi:DNA-binding transcriptional LysR family regulator